MGGTGNGGGSWAEALFGGEKGQRPSAPLWQAMPAGRVGGRLHLHQGSKPEGGDAGARLRFIREPGPGPEGAGGCPHA